jgi:ketosteroid isomerase-like protein
MSAEEDACRSLMKAHDLSFNRAVRSGDFREMLSRFADDAEHVCLRVFLSDHFRGRDAIAQAYAEQPPDDTIELLEIIDGDPVVARYSWSQDEGTQSGRMVLHERAGLIERLIVTFGHEG